MVPGIYKNENQIFIVKNVYDTMENKRKDR